MHQAPYTCGVTLTVDVPGISFKLGSRLGHGSCPLPTVFLLASRWYVWFSVVLGDILGISIAVPSSVRRGTIRALRSKEGTWRWSGILEGGGW